MCSDSARLAEHDEPAHGGDRGWRHIVPRIARHALHADAPPAYRVLGDRPREDVPEQHDAPDCAPLASRWARPRPSRRSTCGRPTPACGRGSAWPSPPAASSTMMYSRHTQHDRQAPHPRLGGRAQARRAWAARAMPQPNDYQHYEPTSDTSAQRDALQRRSPSFATIVVREPSLATMRIDAAPRKSDQPEDQRGSCAGALSWKVSTRRGAHSGREQASAGRFRGKAGAVKTTAATKRRARGSGRGEKSGSPTSDRPSR